MENIQDEQIPQEEIPIQIDLIQTLNDLFQEYQPSFERTQWPMESMRWKELAFCVLETYSSEQMAMTASRAMSELDLLDVRKLTQLNDSLTKNKPSARVKLIHGILQESGFSKESAELALNTLVKAAEVIKDKFNNKIQLLLRKEGKKMIRNVTKLLNFSTLDKKSALQSVTKWLQNVLNLPVLLETESIDAFCNEMDISVDDLIVVADDLDINLALIDELIEQWYTAEIVDKNNAMEVDTISQDEFSDIYSNENQKEG